MPPTQDDVLRAKQRRDDAWHDCDALEAAYREALTRVHDTFKPQLALAYHRYNAFCEDYHEILVNHKNL